ncbi:hypothetical protein [Prescottella agglutinans]|uniref:hypothetical protein n=1 Tax=Prescottella agglutinans TaxID=1644129 RepID=UPI003D98421C
MRPAPIAPSFDAFPVRCAAVVGEQPGTLTITGPKEGQWGRQALGDAHWLNLSTGASGSAPMSVAEYGNPAAVLPTGTGQVVVAVVPEPGTTTPGFVTVQVP